MFEGITAHERVYMELRAIPGCRFLKNTFHHFDLESVICLDLNYEVRPLYTELWVPSILISHTHATIPITFMQILFQDLDINSQSILLITLRM